MFVQFWGVGLSAPSPLAMTPGDVSNHLVADWIPSLPVSLSSSFIGWPPFLLETSPFDGYDVLTISQSAGRSERQWKSVLSWMLGVAGTRHVLVAEGYRWVAPLSAFYPEAVQPVDLSLWNAAFPVGALVATRSPGSRSRLRPDYIAVRPAHGGTSFDWALVESKGTSRCLTNLATCPPPWYTQARNAAISLHGAAQSVGRHLVIATRINPNGVRFSTRRLQVRAWNSAVESDDRRLPAEAALEVAAAHVFGFFRNLGLRENARAIATSLWRRLGTQHKVRVFQGIEAESHARLRQRAAVELQERSQQRPDPIDKQEVVVVAIASELGRVEVEMSDALVGFAKRLQTAEEPSEAIVALREADAELDRWESLRREHVASNVAVLPFGVQVRLPAGFKPRQRPETE